jgi:hypothetical protein
MSDARNQRVGYDLEILVVIRLCLLPAYGARHIRIFEAHRVDRVYPELPDDSVFSIHMGDDCSCTTRADRSEIRIAYALASVPEILPCRISGNKIVASFAYLHSRVVPATRSTATI